MDYKTMFLDLSEVISLTAPATPQTPGRWPLWPASVARYDPFIPSPGPPWISMAFSSFIGEYNHIHLRSNIVHVYIYNMYVYIYIYISLKIWIRQMNRANTKPAFRLEEVFDIRGK